MPNISECFRRFVRAKRPNFITERLHHAPFVGRIPSVRDVPKLFSHNADVDRINATELGKFLAKSKKFPMNSKGKGLVC